MRMMRILLRMGMRRKSLLRMAMRMRMMRGMRMLVRMGMRRMMMFPLSRFEG